MSALVWAIDVVIALTLVGLAALALATADLFRSVVLFIAFGLVMAMAWARLQAVDIALAEAAIGAGLTGALFLNAIGGRVGRPPGASSREDAPPKDPAGVPSRDAAGRPPAARGRTEPPARHAAPHSERSGVARRRGSARDGVLMLALLVLAAGLGTALGQALWSLPATAAGLAPSVGEAIGRSGVSNPVTAVLLNFRAYDTLLEVAVLLLALTGVWVLGPAPRPAIEAIGPGPVLLGLVYVLVPTIGVVGGYLLWAGTGAPGGAFQAGAVLAGIGVLLIVVRLFDPRWLQRPPGRLLMAVGFLGFLAVGVASLVTGARLLQYPPERAGLIILAIEAVLTASIAIVLVALFAGGAAAADSVGGGDHLRGAVDGSGGDGGGPGGTPA